MNKLFHVLVQQSFVMIPLFYEEVYGAKDGSRQYHKIGFVCSLSRCVVHLDNGNRVHDTSLHPTCHYRTAARIFHNPLLSDHFCKMQIAIPHHCNFQFDQSHFSRWHKMLELFVLFHCVVFLFPQIWLSILTLWETILTDFNFDSSIFFSALHLSVSFVRSVV